MQIILLFLSYIFCAQTTNYLCCLAGSAGLGQLTLSANPCIASYQDCQSWGNTVVQWNQIQNIPACLKNCYYPNRRLQEQINFTPCPNFSMIFGGDVNGIYGVFSQTNFTDKLWLHNQTLPQLFNQDIILKGLIDNLVSRI
jgi:hypothetical protein